MKKSATIIPFPFRTFAPSGAGNESGEGLGRQRTLSDAISAIQVHRDILDGLRLPLLALREDWGKGKPLRTLLQLMDRGPEAYSQNVLGEGFYGRANPLPDPEGGTGDVLTLGGDILPEELEALRVLEPLPFSRALSFPFGNVQRYIEALDDALHPEGIRVVPAQSARLPSAWRGLRQSPLVPLFISPGGVGSLPRQDGLPGFLENAPTLTVGYRQWPSLARFAPRALPHLAGAAWKRLESLDAELATRLNGLAESAMAAVQAPAVAASPEACAQSLATALRASAARSGTIGHAPLDPKVAERLLTDK